MQIVPSGAGGGNPSGFNSDSRYPTPIGVGPHSPLLPAPFPAGQNMPPIHSTIDPTARMKRNDPRQGGGGGGIGERGNQDPNSFGGGGGDGGVAPASGGRGGGTSGFNPGSNFGFNPGDQQAFLNAMQSAGFGSGVASLLWNFLSSGAGFNSGVGQALISALQPQVDRGLANIQEQFGVEGLGASSPAAIGKADFLSQVNLNENQIMAQLYEQSVQNYMNVLLAGKTPPKGSGLGALIGGIGSLAGGLLGSDGLSGIDWSKIFGGGGGDTGGGGGGGTNILIGTNDPGVPWDTGGIGG